MELTIASDDAVRILGVAGAFVRVEVVERRGPIDVPLGAVVLGDLVRFVADDGSERQLVVRRYEVSLFDSRLAEPIDPVPAELVPLLAGARGGVICASVRAFRRGERVRLVGMRIEEMPQGRHSA